MWNGSLVSIYIDFIHTNLIQNLPEQKKDPGIPNTFPYKDQILAEVAEQRRLVRRLSSYFDRMSSNANFFRQQKTNNVEKMRKKG